MAFPIFGRPASALLILILLCLSPFTGAAQQLSLRWAFLKPGNDEGSRVVIDFRATPRVAEGDRLQIYFETDGPAFLYLFLLDSGKNLHLLFPPRIEQYAREALAPGTYFLPDEGEWFVMDAAKGSEDFHLLVSRQRLARIEELTKRYLKDAANQRMKADLLMEIINTRNTHSKIAAAVEKGVPIAGTVRSMESEVKILGQATEVRTDAFYGRILRLNHE